KISSNSIILDTENAKVKDIFVNGYKAKYIRKGTFLQLFWNDNNFIYLLNVDYQNSGESEFYEDILIKIAKSIK
ncbi:hypothetical protein XC24_05645, partial [Clostridioides difficile]